ncbi:alpha-glucosidase/alpha-galactosidase [Thermoanaerobacterium sp. RBIITD]|uniref:family 4 glycosyl hydrolase n=1 Tax=Thermoanaerobacterium sp. RBIITD TaxID=1550240 RepID=UPI000BB72E0B|nr:alpha-glucosidase/alpha-galactosidase [Thermoanaerobacterium sp. RBIITD]SNX53414.1 alpha-galactosidase [Thermoanaerobacterium sp. RBIITD]
MRYVDDKVKDLNIAYIGGGSRGWAWNLMSDLAQEGSISGTVKLYDIDYKAAHDNELIGNSLSGREDVKGKWKYKAYESLKEALSDADFVIISILPGTFKEMESDVHMPEKYGIYQSVGDTVGPGGIVRALRTIPMFVDIAKAIKEYCPNAWVINYTNPMTLCVRTLYEVFPQIKAFGCCHEVFGTQKLLSKALMDIKGIDEVPRKDIKINVLGINHFTWIDNARYKGIDLMPIYKEFVDKYYESGFQGNENDNWMNNSFVSAERVKFDLFLRYGIIAAAGDRHLAEFVPGYWYLKDPETVKEWMFGLTPVSWRIEDLKHRLERSKKLVSGEEKFELKDTGEEGVKQIKALLGLEDLVTNVNMPNYGQIEGIPYGAVVETNALFSSNRLKPVLAGRLPDAVNSLVLRQVYNQEATLKAALKKDYDMAFGAFVNDPLVTISLNDAKELFNSMLENTKEYLNGWNL